jgi:uncharacterized protein YxeA
MKKSIILLFLILLATGCSFFSKEDKEKEESTNKITCTYQDLSDESHSTTMTYSFNFNKDDTFKNYEFTVDNESTWYEYDMLKESSEEECGIGQSFYKDVISDSTMYINDGKNGGYAFGCHLYFEEHNNFEGISNKSELESYLKENNNTFLGYSYECQ